MHGYTCSSCPSTRHQRRILRQLSTAMFGAHSSSLSLSLSLSVCLSCLLSLCLSSTQLLVVLVVRHSNCPCLYLCAPSFLHIHVQVNTKVLCLLGVQDRHACCLPCRRRLSLLAWPVPHERTLLRSRGGAFATVSVLLATESSLRYLTWDDVAAFL